MTPIEVSLKKNEEVVRNTLYSPIRNKEPKFKVGDTARLGKCEGLFEKGYEQNHTSEAFKIKRFFIDSHYCLVDTTGEGIPGTIYEQDTVKYVSTGRVFNNVFTLFLVGHFSRSGE